MEKCTLPSDAVLLFYVPFFSNKLKITDKEMDCQSLPYMGSKANQVGSLLSDHMLPRLKN